MEEGGGRRDRAINAGGGRGVPCKQEFTTSFRRSLGSFSLATSSCVQCSAVQCSAVQCSAAQYGGAVVG